MTVTWLKSTSPTVVIATTSFVNGSALRNLGSMTIDYKTWLNTSEGLWDICSVTHLNQNNVIYMVLEKMSLPIELAFQYTYCSAVGLGLEAETVPNRVALQVIL